MMNDIERWYRRCLLQLDWDLSSDRAEEIKDGLNLFVEDPEWLQYVLQESGWFEHSAMVSVFSKMGNDKVLQAVNDPVCLAEVLFLDFAACADSDEVVFNYGQRLSPQAYDFLFFLGWDDCAGPEHIAYGLDDFELTWKSIQRGDVVGVDGIADFLFDSAARVSEDLLLADLDVDNFNASNGKNQPETPVNDCSIAEVEGHSYNIEHLQAIIEPALGHERRSLSYLALKAHICAQIIANPEADNVIIYNKVAVAIEETSTAGKFDGELKVQKQIREVDKQRPFAIFRYVRRNPRKWVLVSVRGFAGQAKQVRELLSMRRIKL